MIYFIVKNNNIKTINTWDTFERRSESIVLMIGDGMGFDHIEATKAYFGIEELNMEKLASKGFVITDSLAVSIPTDSASATTALATGKKVNNGQLSYHDEKSIETIVEIATRLNKGIGIITTDNLFDATLIAFTSHTSSRGNTSDIINQQIQGSVDLFLIAGSSYYASYSLQIEEAGFAFVTEFSELRQTTNKILGSFSGVGYSSRINIFCYDIYGK